MILCVRVALISASSLSVQSFLCVSFLGAISSALPSIWVRVEEWRERKQKWIEEEKRKVKWKDLQCDRRIVERKVISWLLVILRTEIVILVLFDYYYYCNYIDKTIIVGPLDEEEKEKKEEGKVHQMNWTSSV